jgi:hypothetical protein
MATGIKALDLLINASYKGASAFRQAQADIAKTEKDSDRAGKAIGTSFRGVAAGIGVATAALGAIAVGAKVAWDTLGEGAQLELARSRFDNLAASINTTGDALLGKLKDATNGMMSDAALVASATDMMSLGLAKTEEQAVRMTTVVGKLGWDMQQVVLTMANNSKMRLDALGLSVEDVDRRTKALVATGMSMEQAFDLAVIEAGEAKIQLLGDSSQTTAGKIQQLKVIWQDATNAFKEEFAASVVDQINAVGEAAQNAGPGLEKGMAEMGRKAGDVYGAALAEVAAVGMESINKELATTLGLSARQINEITRQAYEASGTNFFQFDAGEALAFQQAVNEILETTYALELAGINARSEWEDWGQFVGPVSELGQAYEYLIRQYEKAAAAADVAASKEAAFQEWLRGRDREDEAVTGTGRAYEYLINQYERAADIAEETSDVQAKAAEEAADAAEENARRIAEAFQQAAMDASGAFNDAITALQDIELPDLFSESGAVNMEIFGDAIYQAGVNAGFSVTQLGELGVATGEFTPQMAEAAEKTALFYAALDILAQQRKVGALDTSEYLTSVQELITTLETSSVAEIELKLKQTQNPARELWAHLPAEERTQEIEVEMTPVDTALWSALDTFDAEMEQPRTIYMEADTEAVNVAIGEVQAGILGIDGTVPFTGDTKGIDADIRNLEDTYIVIPVRFEAVNSIPTGPGKAGGGPVSGGVPYIVGEMGPELFVPNMAGHIVPNSQLRGMKPGELTVNMTVNFHGPVDNPRAVQSAIRNGLQQFYADIEREGVSW